MESREVWTDRQPWVLPQLPAGPHTAPGTVLTRGRELPHVHVGVQAQGEALSLPGN